MNSSTSNRTRLQVCRAAMIASFATALVLPVYAGVASADTFSAPSAAGGGASLMAAVPALLLLIAGLFLAGRGRQSLVAAVGGPRFCPFCGSTMDTGEIPCGNCGRRLA